MREDTIATAVNDFFAHRVFGAMRRDAFLTELNTVDDSQRQERAEKRQRMKRALADIDRKQDNLLRQAENADPADPFTQGLRKRYHDLETQRQEHHTAIAGLDLQDQEEPDRPSARPA